MRKSKVLSVAASTALVAAILMTGCGNNDSDGGTAGSGGGIFRRSDRQEAGSSTASGETSGGENAEGGENDLLPALSDSEMEIPGNCTIPRSNYVQYPYEGAEGITLKYWMSVHGNILKNPKTSDSVQMTEWAKQWQELTGITIEFVGPTSVG